MSNGVYRGHKLFVTAAGDKWILRSLYVGEIKGMPCVHGELSPLSDGGGLAPRDCALDAILRLVDHLCDEVDHSKFSN